MMNSLLGVSPSAGQGGSEHASEHTWSVRERTCGAANAGMRRRGADR
jgi:hypothetical protein